MKPVEQCKTLKALFVCQERWVQRYWQGYRDAKGHLTTIEDSSHVIPCFCLDGGLDQVYGKNTPAKEKATKRIVAAVLRLGLRKRMPHGQSGIISFNDSRRTRWEHIKAVIHAARV